MNRTYVLDASALLDYVDGGPGANRIEQLLKEAERTHSPLLMSVVNWGEVYYTSWQTHGEEQAQKLMAHLSRLPIRVMDADLNHSLRAAEVKVRHKIPYADCFAAAAAILEQATLVTADRDFEKLGRRVRIRWITRP